MAGSAQPTGKDPNRESVGDHLLDLVVYLPAGVLTAVAEDLPELTARGRAAVEQQIRSARGVGQVMVVLGRRTLERRIRDVLATASTAPGSTAPDPAPPPEAPPTEPAPEPPAPTRTPAVTTAEVDAVIPGYDTLPASLVVRRLDGLSPAELDVVARYEAAGRGRRTILHRSRQLQVPSSRPSRGPT